MKVHPKATSKNRPPLSDRPAFLQGFQGTFFKPKKPMVQGDHHGPTWMMILLFRDCILVLPRAKGLVSHNALFNFILEKKTRVLKFLGRGPKGI